MPRFQRGDNRSLSRGEKAVFVLIISPILFLMTLGGYVILSNAKVDNHKISCDQIH